MVGASGEGCGRDGGQRGGGGSAPALNLRHVDVQPAGLDDAGRAAVGEQRGWGGAVQARVECVRMQLLNEPGQHAVPLVQVQLVQVAWSVAKCEGTCMYGRKEIKDWGLAGKVSLSPAMT